MIAARSLETWAEVLESLKAIRALATGGKYPRDAYTLPFLKPRRCGAASLDYADDLVTGNDGIARRRCASFYFVELGMAYSAAGNTEPDLVHTRLGSG